MHHSSASQLINLINVSNGVSKNNNHVTLPKAAPVPTVIFEMLGIELLGNEML
jgi:hypothetical protein